MHLAKLAEGKLLNILNGAHRCSPEIAPPSYPPPLSPPSPGCGRRSSLTLLLQRCVCFAASTREIRSSSSVALLPRRPAALWQGIHARAPRLHQTSWLVVVLTDCTGSCCFCSASPLGFETLFSGASAPAGFCNFSLSENIQAFLFL